MSMVGGLFRLARPRQWTKNVLVLAAPFAAGRILEPKVLLAAVAAIGALVLVSAGVYMLNDVLDVHEDRQHPKKRARPVASGEVPVPYALATGTVLAAGGLALAFWVTLGLGLVALAYAVMQIAYTVRLKHQPVVDLTIVSMGFLLRAVAGGAACKIPLSEWFLLVTAFGSLFMVAGKRFSEKHNAVANRVTRKSLDGYTLGYLRFVWGMAATATVVFYALWALGEHHTGRELFSLISLAPFVLAILRYAVDVENGLAESPEDIVLHDRALQIHGLVWLATYTLGLLPW